MAPAVWALNMQLGQVLPYAECGAGWRLSATVSSLCIVVACLSGWVSWHAASAQPIGGLGIALHGEAVRVTGRHLRVRAAAAGHSWNCPDRMRAMTCRAVGWAFVACLLPGLAQAHGGGADEPIGWTLDPWVVTPLLLAGGALRHWRVSAVAPRRRRTWRAWLARRSLMPADGPLWPARWFHRCMPWANSCSPRIWWSMKSSWQWQRRCWSSRARPWSSYGRGQIRCGKASPVAVRHDTTRAIWSLATAPVAATVLHGLAIWIWHVPVLFDAAVTHIALHRLQHLSFLLTALLFWWALLRNCGAGAATGHLFITMTHTELPGRVAHLRSARPLWGADDARRRLGADAATGSATGRLSHVGPGGHHLCRCGACFRCTLDRRIRECVGGGQCHAQAVVRCGGYGRLACWPSSLRQRPAKPER